VECRTKDRTACSLGDFIFSEISGPKAVPSRPAEVAWLHNLEQAASWSSTVRRDGVR